MADKLNCRGSPLHYETGFDFGGTKGFYSHEHADVFVTVGTGMVGVPFRFRVPPTIDIINYAKKYVKMTGSGLKQPIKY